MTAVVMLGLLASCGYDVDPLSGTANSNANDLGPGDQFTLEELFNVPCETVSFVGAYSSDTERDRLVGNANVSMEGQDQFVLAAAFDAAGNRVAATRLGRVPVDFDDFGGQTVPCDETVEVVRVDGEGGRPVR